MKSTGALLILLACTIGLGGAYAFFPKQLETSHPDFTVKSQRSLHFSKQPPYLLLEKNYIVHYSGQKPIRIEAWGDGLVAVTPLIDIEWGYIGPTWQPMNPGETRYAPGIGNLNLTEKVRIRFTPSPIEQDNPFVRHEMISVEFEL